MEAAAVWSLFANAPWWRSGAAAGLLVAGVAAAMLLVARRRAGPVPLLENDSTMGDDDDGTGFRSSRFAARVCSACSQPMLLEDDGRWRCAAYPVCWN